MISKEELIKMRKKLFVKADELLVKKGSDYNRLQQLEGDTLFNLRVPHMMGITSNNYQYILARLNEKIMRLSSILNSDGKAAVKDESIEDTVLDVVNYVTYVLAFYREGRK